MHDGLRDQYLLNINYIQKIIFEHVHANHMVFSIDGLKSILIVWTSSNVTTTFSSNIASSKSELKYTKTNECFFLLNRKWILRSNTSLFVCHLSFIIKIKSTWNTKCCIVNWCWNGNSFCTSNIRVT